MKSVIDTVFSFEDIPQAMAYYGTAKQKGKVVVTVD
ncbi:MAG: hypothetical protein DWQ10_04075 [Calditrichaeota bacterium]|nr:MAG: hypothetical protein DWQ10_04075 [Calditrichota bacterium]